MTDIVISFWVSFLMTSGGKIKRKNPIILIILNNAEHGKYLLRSGWNTVLIPMRSTNCAFIPISITNNLFPTARHQSEHMQHPTAGFNVEWINVRPYLSFICLMCTPMYITDIFIQLFRNWHMSCIISFLWVSCWQNNAKEQELTCVQLRLFMGIHGVIKLSISFEKKLYLK